MARTDRSRVVAWFALSVCPVSAALGTTAFALFSWGGREGALAQAAAVALWFGGFCVLGLAAVVLLLPEPTSRLFAGRRWVFPVACGLGVSAAVLTRLVERTANVLDTVLGPDGFAVFLASAVLWTAVVTLAVEAADRVMARKAEKGGQIA